MASQIIVNAKQARLLVGTLIKGKRRSKYGNKRTTTADGVNHPSGKQARRWAELRLCQRAGEIYDLRREVPFELIVNGDHVCTYIADHVYQENGIEVVEDVKSEATANDKVYQIKRKLMKACHGIDVREV